MVSLHYILMKFKTCKKIARYFIKHPRAAVSFVKDLRTWNQNAPAEWQACIDDTKLHVHDSKKKAGNACGHYFLQDIWAARHVHTSGVGRHVDIASRVDGFVAHVAAFTEIEYVDIRPLEVKVPGILYKEGSICALPYPDQSIQSLSCLHVIEHIGLGRYKDPVDPNSVWVALKELQRVLAPGGQLLIGTPCGKERTVFHEHRVFSAKRIINAFNELTLMELSLIVNNSATAWSENVTPEFTDKLDYGCGLFRFQRPRA